MILRKSAKFRLVQVFKILNIAECQFANRLRCHMLCSNQSSVLLTVFAATCKSRHYRSLVSNARFGNAPNHFEIRAGRVQFTLIR